MDEGYRAGLRWLAYSGIQAESGGVARYYAGDRGEYRNISTEITAYAIQAYLHLPLPGQTGLLSNALRAAQFLCYDAGDPVDGLFPHELPRKGAPSSGVAYFFDCGVIIRALLALWNITADPMYLERAEACGDVLVSLMSRIDGSYFPLIDIATRAPSQGSDAWSVEPGPYQLKVGLAFLELAEVTSSGLFTDGAEKLLDSCLRTHELFLRGDPAADRTADRLHAYCYFLEGVLPFVEKRFECGQILQGGISRVETMMEETSPALQRSDTIAQLLRLRLMADYLGVTELDLSAASREAESLPAFQFHGEDGRTNGGFSFGRREGELTLHANPISTIFCLQALRFWNEYRQGGFRATWRELI